MAWKINIGKIVADHVRSLSSAHTNKADLTDWISFVGIPILVTAILLISELFISSSIIPPLISSLAIFMGLLLNSIMILLNILRNKETHFKVIKLEILRETLSNISFTILLSIFNIVFLLLTQLPQGNLLIVKYLLNGISMMGLSLFLVTLLMVIKRIYALFASEIDGRMNDTK